MNQLLLRSVWIAFRIWLLAVLINAATGTFVLSFNSVSVEIFFIGLMVGGVCALPVLFIQAIVIYTAGSTGTCSRLIFRQTMIAGEVVTAVIVLIFFGWLGIPEKEALLLACTALLSGALATGSHMRSLYELGSDHENEFLVQDTENTDQNTGDL